MKKIVKGFLTMTFVLTFFGCNTNPKPIVYGTDGCHFCRMTIVDRQHAAEFVTQKGKTCKFDAIECMVNHLAEIDKNSVNLFLVNDYNQPGDFINALEATYLISKNVPSPMGEYLTAFNTKEEAEKIKSKKEGKLYSWEEILNYLNK